MRTFLLLCLILSARPRNVDLSQLCYERVLQRYPRTNMTAMLQSTSVDSSPVSGPVPNVSYPQMIITIILQSNPIFLNILAPVSDRERESLIYPRTKITALFQSNLLLVSFLAPVCRIILSVRPWKWISLNYGTNPSTSVASLAVSNHWATRDRTTELCYIAIHILWVFLLLLLLLPELYEHQN